MGFRELLIAAIDWFAWIIYILIFIRVILSWLPFDRHNPLIKFVYGMTEPILAPIRNMIFKSPMGGPGMMIDFSPLIALIGLQVVSGLLISVVRAVL